MNYSDYSGTPGQQPPQPRKRHRVRNALWITGCAVIAVIALAIALAPASIPRPAARPATTVTHSAVAKPAATQSAAPAKPAAPAVLGHFTGSGDYSSAPFTVNGSPVTVTYSYSGNIMPGEQTGDNFMADLASSGDDQQIVNAIGVSGGTTTTIYPDTSFGGSTSYHLSVVATGAWSVTLTEASS